VQVGSASVAASTASSSLVVLPTAFGAVDRVVVSGSGGQRMSQFRLEVFEDRLRMLEILSHFNPQPESVPINSLVPIPGTPLAEAQGVDSFEVVRMIALARIAIPKAKVRLSAGRKQMSEEMQALCFFAGANSIFYGDKLLTTGNPQSEADLNLLRKLGLQPQKPNRDLTAPEAESCRPLAPALA
jgi:biotin synthase